ncbi:MAG: GNAT family N-acetyltransferase, partial [Phycisphaerae bacterium]
SIWADQMRSRLPQRSTLALLGLRGDTPAGFLTGQLKVIPPLYQARMGGIFQDMYTLPKFRRQGLARSLVQAGIDRFAEIGAESIEIQIAHLNERSLSFWTSLGWEHEVFQMRNFITPAHRGDGSQPCSGA